MKQYPSIPKEIQNISAFAYAKIDGSNIRAEWNSKRGFYKFGSRTQLLSPEQGIIHSAIDLIKEKESSLTKIIRNKKISQCVFFFEFHGENSFAGNHDPHDNHKVSLIDINIHKMGMLAPKEFNFMFGNSDFTAPLLYNGKITNDFIQSVKESKFPGMPLEGVVCKANNPKNKHNPIMFKIKSNAWLNKLKNFCGDDVKLFNKLS